MNVIAIHRALTPSVIEFAGRTTRTGLCKTPVSGSIAVGLEGLEGDIQVDRANHGGPDKALYVYTLENYRHWERLLNSDPLTPGTFGENLTVTAMPDHDISIGDQFRIGPILVQVTQPRVPCFKLGLRMKDSHFVGAFLKSGRTGFYLRVLETGVLSPGDTIRCESRDTGRVTIDYATRALLKGPHQQETIQKVLSVAALSEAWRQDLEKRLEKPSKETP